jgi:protein-L-isoaspartate(D-aspartate) O-methyltransferase
MSNKTSAYISGKNVLLFIGGIIIGLSVGIFLPRWVPGLQNHAAGASVSQKQAAEQLIAELEEKKAEPAGEKIPEKPETETDYELEEETQVFFVEQHLGSLPLSSKEEYIEYMLENTDESEEYLQARWELSRRFLESGELQGAALEGFLRTPREHFVREKNYKRAYDDSWLPIGYGATITDPDVVAMMTTTLNVQPDNKVLEIGTGSGYQSAILSNISDNVYSIEIIEPLYYETNDLYNDLSVNYPQYTNIKRKLGDGYYGWEKYAPFDKIVVTCSIDHLPPPLLQQLSPGGIMVIPLGNPGRQYIMEVKKTLNDDGDIILRRRDVYNGLSVKFIPFLDKDGKSYSEGTR